ncbi:hypothetical protein [uncultured Jatrophihabitans sp.]|uniref:hypothetical protein n=1 Tax=uncultured Jatrophihabitans sp. TaxID=1610747 RepID=UPI0035CA179F
MRQLPPGLVFTADAAAQYGWTRSALRHGVRTGRVLRMGPGVFCAPEAADVRAIAVAAALRHADGVLSHRTAALMRDTPVVGGRPDLAEMTFAPGAGANRAGVHVHRAHLPPTDIDPMSGVPVTSAARTVVDIARNRPLVTGVAAMDDVLHRELADEKDILRVLHECANWTGARRAKLAWSLVDARSESALESASRLRLRELGVCAPELQKSIFDTRGRFVTRVDFYWDEYGVYGEADGRTKYVDRATLWLEKQREDELGRLGLVAARWGWDEAWHRPRLIRERVLSAFGRGRARDRSGFPRKWSL